MDQANKDKNISKKSHTTFTVKQEKMIDFADIHIDYDHSEDIEKLLSHNMSNTSNIHDDVQYDD